eukprot:262948-Amphidinium_carterae.1
MAGPLTRSFIASKNKSGADVKATLVETHPFFSSAQHPELLKMSDGRIKRIQSDRKNILHTTTTGHDRVSNGCAEQASSKEITREGKPVEMELELDMERKDLTPEEIVTPQWRVSILCEGCLFVKTALW